MIATKHRIHDIELVVFTVKTQLPKFINKKYLWKIE